MTLEEIIEADAPAQDDAPSAPQPALRYAIVEPDSRLVRNIIDAADGFVLEGASLVLDDGSAVIGGSWDGVMFLSPAPEPEPRPAVPATISFRQLILGLLESGLLTAEQALAAAEARARPPQLDAIIATLPDDAALAARITWAAMTEARRGDPLVTALITAGHATAAQVDELFRRAAGL